MRKILLIIAFAASLGCRAQIDLFTNCPKVTWHETVEDVRKMFPYSSAYDSTNDSPNLKVYTALNIENVTLCGVALKGRAVFNKKSQTLVRLIFNPIIDDDRSQEINMTFGYFRGLLFAKLGAPKIVDPYKKGIVYSGKYKWKKDNMYISVDIFSGSTYSHTTLDIDSEDW